MLIEVHILQNHSPSNLNRDDTGSPKDAIFGGYKRARISSQCLKRSIRRSDFFGPDIFSSLAVRTRKLPELVRKKLLELGISKELAEEAAKKVAEFGISTKNEKKETKKEDTKKKSDSPSQYKTAQTMFLTSHDVDTITKRIVDLITEDEKQFREIKSEELQKQIEDKGYRPITVDVALFGRMTTSNVLIDVEASSQFAHAISTHKTDHEFDYFTAVDDLERSLDDEAGSGADMIGDIEFNSACYYKYFNLHVDGLIGNLTGKVFNRKVSEEDEAAARALAAAAARALIEAACRVTPTGKQNSFAAYQLPGLVWIEVRDKNMPVSYSNAFVEPVKPRVRDGLELASINCLKAECEKLTSMYDLQACKRLLLSKYDGIEILGVNPAKNIKVLLDELEAEVVRG